MDPDEVKCAPEKAVVSSPTGALYLKKDNKLLVSYYIFGEYVVRTLLHTTKKQMQQTNNAFTVPR